MMATMRTKRSPEFKAKIVLAPLRGDKMINELASIYSSALGTVYPIPDDYFLRHAITNVNHFGSDSRRSPDPHRNVRGSADSENP